MHKLYFTRHGETVWNVENKICGMTDSPLTERGRAQARALGQKVKACFADRYDGGESMLQLAQRIYNLLDELRDQPDKTYLLVAHNGIARVVESYFHDMTNEEYALAGIRNCELVEYHFE